MSQRAIQHLCRFRERNLFLRGLVPSIGYQTDSVYYNRDKRFAGESKYPFRKMLNFAIDGITSFSVKPVRMNFLDRLHLYSCGTVCQPDGHFTLTHSITPSPDGHH